MLLYQQILHIMIIYDMQIFLIFFIFCYVSLLIQFIHNYFEQR